MLTEMAHTIASRFVDLQTGLNFSIQNVVSLPSVNTVVSPRLISQTTWFFKPIFIFLGGSNNKDFMVLVGSVAAYSMHTATWNTVVNERNDQSSNLMLKSTNCSCHHWFC